MPNSPRLCCRYMLSWLQVCLQPEEAQQGACALQVAFASFTDFGGIMALAIAVHNIPEGVIVAAPVFAATGNRWAALGIALASVSSSCKPDTPQHVTFQHRASGLLPTGAVKFTEQILRCAGPVRTCGRPCGTADCEAIFE